MAAPSTSSPVPRRKTNVNQLKILCRVVKKIKEDVDSGTFPLSKDAEETASRYTGMQPKVIQHLENCEELVVNIKEVDRYVVYSKLMDFYLYKKMMPTTYQLFIALENELPIYINIGEFRKMLVKMDFMWKHITNKLFVIIEKPRVIFERFNYLKNIKRYRKKKVPIYYIEENAIQSKLFANNVKKNLIYAVSETGVHFIKDIDSFSPQSCLKWIKDTLIMSLSSPSVIVLNNSKHHCEEIVKVPNADSIKAEMIEWLDYFNVPYHSEMPKVMLHDLIRIYTDVSKKLYKIDSILEANGHTVLRIPNCICKVNPGALVYQTVQSNIGLLINDAVELSIDEVMVKFQEIIATINSEMAVSFTQSVIKQERDLYEIDLMFDDIVDELEEETLNFNSITQYVDSDIPSCDDSD